MWAFIPGVLSAAFEFEVEVMMIDGNFETAVGERAEIVRQRRTWTMHTHRRHRWQGRGRGTTHWHWNRSKKAQ